MNNAQRRAAAEPTEPILPAPNWTPQPMTRAERTVLTVAAAIAVLVVWLVTRGMYLATRELLRWL